MRGLTFNRVKAIGYWVPANMQGQIIRTLRERIAAYCVYQDSINKIVFFDYQEGRGGEGCALGEIRKLYTIERICKENNLNYAGLQVIAGRSAKWEVFRTHAPLSQFARPAYSECQSLP
jgi:hypothetical protein